MQRLPFRFREQLVGRTESSPLPPRPTTGTACSLSGSIPHGNRREISSSRYRRPCDCAARATCGTRKGPGSPPAAYAPRPLRYGIFREASLRVAHGFCLRRPCGTRAVAAASSRGDATSLRDGFRPGSGKFGLALTVVCAFGNQTTACRVVKRHAGAIQAERCRLTWARHFPVPQRCRSAVRRLRACPRRFGCCAGLGRWPGAEPSTTRGRTCATSISPITMPVSCLKSQIAARAPIF